MPSLPPTYKVASNSRKRAQYNYDQTRQPAHLRGYDHKWHTVRLDYLQRHPLCANCLKQGLYKQASNVDHITPAVLRPDLFWDEDNYQALCHSCHSSKTAKENNYRFH